MKKLALRIDSLSVATFPTGPAQSVLTVTEPCLFTPSCPMTGAGSCWCTDRQSCDCP
ncbi:MAG TPA: hypothetical protein VLK84_02610 [Longimicrobium sp.]|nr:hypothetical protein [Longimicrobium sp.]